MATFGQTITARFTGDLTGLRTAMTRAQAMTRRASAGMSKGFRRIKTAVILTTAAIVALGAASSKAFAEFSAEMTKIETLVGVNAELVGQFNQQILDMAGAVGVGPQELAKAMFVITSAGERGADAIKILEQAAKAAAAGLGDTAEIARTATAAMQAFKSSGMTAARAVDIMVATVREGNLAAEELAGALGTVMGPAATMGVTMEEVGAFVATYTRLGVDARIATTALRATLMALLKPGDQARQAFQAMGTSVEEMTAKLGTDGLQATLREIIERSEEFNVNIADIIPNVRALSGVLGSAGVQAETYKQIVESINEAQGITNEAFERTKEELAFIARQLRAQFAVALITVGEVFAPIAQSIVERLRDWIALIRENKEEVQSFARDALTNLGKAVGWVGAKVTTVIKFFMSHPISAGWGLVGLVFFGPAGAAALAAMGAAIDTLAAKLFGPVNVMERHRDQIKQAEEELQAILELQGRLIQGEGFPRQFRMAATESQALRDAITSRDIEAALAAIKQRMIELNMVMRMNNRAMEMFGEDPADAMMAWITAANEFFTTLEEGGFQWETSTQRVKTEVEDIARSYAIIGGLHSTILVPMELYNQLAVSVADETERTHRFVKQTKGEVEETTTLMEGMGRTVEGNVSGGISDVLLNMRSVTEAAKGLGRTIVRLIVQALVRATAQALALAAAMSAVKAAIGGGIFPIGGIPILRHGGFPKAQHGMMVPDSPRLTRGVPIVAHPGEAVITRRGVRALGGASGVHALNAGGNVPAGNVTLQVEMGEIPDPTDFEIFATSPALQRFLAVAMEQLKVTGFTMDN